jgi:hypothetical protein
MKRFCSTSLIFIILVFTSYSAFSEQTFGGKVKKIEIVNYQQGAAYVYFEGASFNECSVTTNWCAIDLSLPASNQMYAAVLAAKMADKSIKVTSNSCWSIQYPRCWKVHVD